MKTSLSIPTLLLLLLVPLGAQAQASKPSKAKGGEAKEILDEALGKLRAGSLYEAWDLAQVVLANEPKNARAAKIRNAARLLSISIDARVVASKPAEVLISVGSDDRVAVGQVFTLYSGTKALALVRVTEVGRDSSQAKVFETKGKVPLGAQATSSGVGWSWFHEGKQRALPEWTETKATREAIELTERRRLYDLYLHAARFPKDALLKLYRESARLAQRVVSGEVLKVEGRSVTLDVGTSDGLRRGDVVTFTKAGKALGRGRVKSLSPSSASVSLDKGASVETGQVATTDSAHWPIKH